MCFELDFETPSSDVTGIDVNCLVMEGTRVVMARLGMLTADEPPDEPNPADHGTTMERIEVFLDSDAEDPPPDLVSFAAAMREMFDAQADKPSGIPRYKLTSSDGWLVTPAEITAALGWWATTPPDRQRAVKDGVAWWPAWINFLKDASDQGGFRVW